METTDLAVESVERYLLRLKLALGDVPAAQREDFVREIRSHIVDRLAHEPGNSEQACHAILQTLGDPEAIAKDYRGEWLMARASRLQWLRTQASRMKISWDHLRMALRWTVTGVQWLLYSTAAFTGYLLAACFYLTALLKPVFPRNVGLFFTPMGPVLAQWPAPEAPELLGAAYTPLALVLGFFATIGTKELLSWILRRFRQLKKYL